MFCCSFLFFLCGVISLGIYIWGEPVQHKGASVVLVDTEGIGSTEQDQSYDVKIFSLALLLSSFFIYNSMGVIDERALEGLSLVVHLTEHISTKSGLLLFSFCFFVLISLFFPVFVFFFLVSVSFYFSFI